jgi:hypothetical protein
MKRMRKKRMRKVSNGEVYNATTSGAIKNEINMGTIKKGKKSM